MVCPACASPVPDGVRFCARCGAPLASSLAPPPPQAPYFQPAPGLRVQRNLQTAGILWFVYGAYRVIGGLIGMLILRAFTFRTWPFLGGDAPFHPGFRGTWPSVLLPVIATVTLTSTALAFFVGYSLLQRKPWGRTLAIVVAILSLFRPLLGTALGIYTLWLLAPAASGFEYDAIADRT
jgi:hypothetical protein